MQKRLVYSGLLLIALSVILFSIIASSTSSTFSKLYGDLVYKNITVNSNSLYYIDINSTTAYPMLMGLGMHSPAQVFLFNASSFSSWISGAGPKSGLSGAILFEGKGLMLAYNNTMNVSIPTEPNNALVYQSNSSKISSGELPIGSYKLVIDNANGSSSLNTAINATYVYLPSSSISSITGSASGMGIMSIVALLLFISGLVLLVYGIIKRSPSVSKSAVAGLSSGTPSDEAIDQLYKGIDSGKQKTGLHPKAQRLKKPSASKRRKA
ncbi:hypothetical protein M1439_01105 [Candidatus Marsarchaeota archaeon]|jgi:hypothetical protein|nr:hypothetical protein [Candidatus Marsarchaeota archaeon]MCL5092451.1 hypothetical protein [Candidatus Marsarchaeota archaeon]